MELADKVNALTYVLGPKAGERYNIFSDRVTRWFRVETIHNDGTYDLFWEDDGHLEEHKEMSFKANVKHAVPDPCALSPEEFHLWLEEHSIFDQLFGAKFHAQLLATKGTEFVVYLSKHQLLTERHAKYMVSKAVTVHDSEKKDVHTLLVKVLTNLAPESQVTLLQAIGELQPIDAMHLISICSVQWWKLSSELDPMGFAALTSVLYHTLEKHIAARISQGSFRYKDLVETDAEYSQQRFSVCLELLAKIIPEPKIELADEEHSRSPGLSPGGGEAASSQHIEEDGDLVLSVRARAPNHSASEEEWLHWARQAEKGGLVLNLVTQAEAGNFSSKHVLIAARVIAMPLRVQYVYQSVMRLTQAVKQSDGERMAHNLYMVCQIFQTGCIEEQAGAKEFLRADFIDLILQGLLELLQDKKIDQEKIDCALDNAMFMLLRLGEMHMYDLVSALNETQLKKMFEIIEIATPAFRDAFLKVCVNSNFVPVALEFHVLEYLCRKGGYEQYSVKTAEAFIHLFIKLNVQADKIDLHESRSESPVDSVKHIARVRTSALIGLEAVWDAALWTNSGVSKRICQLLARCFCVEGSCATSHDSLLMRLDEMLQTCVVNTRGNWDGIKVIREAKRLQNLLDVTRPGLDVAPQCNCGAGEDLMIEVVLQDNAAVIQIGMDIIDYDESSSVSALVAGTPPPPLHRIQVNTNCSMAAFRRHIATKFNVANAQDIILKLSMSNDLNTSQARASTLLSLETDAYSISECGIQAGDTIIATHEPDVIEFTPHDHTQVCTFGLSVAFMVFDKPDSECQIYESLQELCALAHLAGDMVAFRIIWSALISFPTKASLKESISQPSTINWEQLLCIQQPILVDTTPDKIVVGAKGLVSTLYTVQVLCMLLHPADGVEMDKLTAAQEYHREFMSHGGEGLKRVVHLFLSHSLKDSIIPPLLEEILLATVHCLRLCIATRHLRCTGGIQVLLNTVASADKVVDIVNALLRTFSILVEAYEASQGKPSKQRKRLSLGATDAMQVLKAMSLSNREVANLLMQSKEVLAVGLTESSDTRIRASVQEIILALASPHSGHKYEALDFMRFTIRKVSSMISKGLKVKATEYQASHVVSPRVQDANTSSTQVVLTDALNFATNMVKLENIELEDHEKTIICIAECIEKHPSDGRDDSVLNRWLQLLREIFHSGQGIFEFNRINTKNLASMIFHSCLHALPSPAKPFHRPKCVSPDARQSAVEVLFLLAKLSGAITFDLWNSIEKVHRGLPLLTGWEEAPMENNLMLTGQHHVGLKNQGSTCYQNSVLQQIFMLPHAAEKILSAHAQLVKQGPAARSWPDSQNEDSKSVNMKISASLSTDVEDNGILGQVTLLNELAITLSFLTESVGSWYDPLPFVEACEKSLVLAHPIRRQNDASEFLHALVEGIDKAVKGGPYEKLLEDCFGGERGSCLTAEVDGVMRERPGAHEDFTVLELDVQGMKGVYEALAESIKDEHLSGVIWEGIERPIDSVKRTRVTQPPRHLALYLKRYAFDLTSMSYTRLNDRFEFPIDLDMTPYMEESQEKGGKPTRYRLGGILIQSGSVSAGHYYSFIKDRFTGEWYKFDDKAVSPFDVDTIEFECFGGFRLSQEPINLANGDSTVRNINRQTEKSAYMLIYDREDVVQDLGVKLDRIVKPLTKGKRQDEMTTSDLPLRIQLAKPDAPKLSVPVNDTVLHDGSLSGKTMSYEGGLNGETMTPRTRLDNRILASNLSLMQSSFAYDAPHTDLLQKLSKITSEMIREEQQADDSDETQMNGTGAIHGIATIAHNVSCGFWLQHITRLAVQGEYQGSNWVHSLQGLYEDEDACKAFITTPLETLTTAILECPNAKIRESVVYLIRRVVEGITVPSYSLLRPLWKSLVGLVDLLPPHGGRSSQLLELIHCLLNRTDSIDKSVMIKAAQDAGMIWRLVRLLLPFQWELMSKSTLKDTVGEHVLSEKLIAYGDSRDGIELHLVYKSLSTLLVNVADLQGPCSRAIWAEGLLALMLKEASDQQALSYVEALTQGKCPNEPGFETRLVTYIAHPAASPKASPRSRSSNYPQLNSRCLRLLFKALEVTDARTAERAVIITSAVLDCATDAKEENQMDQYIAYIIALAKLSRIPFIKQCLEADSSRWLSLMERHSADSSPIPTVEELVIFLWDTIKDYNDPDSPSPASSACGDPPVQVLEARIEDPDAISNIATIITERIEVIFEQLTRESLSVWAFEALDAIDRNPAATDEETVELAVHWIMENHDQLVAGALVTSPSKRRKLDIDDP